MAGCRAVLAVFLVGVLAACGTSGAPGVAITPAAASPAAAATQASPAAAATPRLTPKPTPVPVPPKPTGVKFDEHVRELDDDGEVVKITQTVRWRAPRSQGVEIRVYGVIECIARPAHPRSDTHGPCLVTHTPLPASVLTLLARVPASAGKVSWSWTQETGCDYGPFSSDPDGPTYRAVVLAAYGASGYSIFAIAEPGEWWEYGPNVVVC